MVKVIIESSFCDRMVIFWNFICSCFVLFSLLNLSLFATEFKCPEYDGQYEDPKQCDKYYQCENGRAYEKLCQDGLVFDPTIRKINKCDQPFNVDCGDRQELQPPQSNALCPRRNGFFAHPDESICDVFYNCIEGEATEVPCTQGLHFDEYSGTCVWPESANRNGCRTKEVLVDGFQCPKESSKDIYGQSDAHPKYAHPTDCQKFYVCLNGKEPRELGCQVGEVYNEESQRCDAPENVAGWYISCGFTELLVFQSGCTIKPKIYLRKLFKFNIMSINLARRNIDSQVRFVRVRDNKI